MENCGARILPIGEIWGALSNICVPFLHPTLRALASGAKHCAQIAPNWTQLTPKWHPHGANGAQLTLKWPPNDTQTATH